MKIIVRAKPNSKNEKIEKINETRFKVFVKEPPREGRANNAIGKALAGYFNIPPSQVQLVSGFTSKQKIFEIS